MTTTANASAYPGSGSAKLGLHGRVTRDEFLRLCDNLHPQTGELLTQRKKTTRRALDENGNHHQAANRRVFYDFAISPPKDVSILALVGKDNRITAAHDRAIRTAMTEMEQFAATRVRVAGGRTDRQTGNIVGAIFRHSTSRALDPHLHSDCIVFNLGGKSCGQPKNLACAENFGLNAHEAFCFCCSHASERIFGEHRPIGFFCREAPLCHAAILDGGDAGDSGAIWRVDAGAVEEPSAALWSARTRFRPRRLGSSLMAVTSG